jgi:serine/threonine-protein kinase RsbW
MSSALNLFDLAGEVDENSGPVISLEIGRLAEAYPIAASIGDLMRALDYPPLDIYSVRLTLLEAAANAVQHGIANDPNKRIQIRYVVRPSETVVEVRDEGTGFDPAAVPEPCLDENLHKPSGRGVFLMRVYSNSVSFNPQGNQVTLCRRRSEP